MHQMSLVTYPNIHRSCTREAGALSAAGNCLPDVSRMEFLLCPLDMLARGWPSSLLRPPPSEPSSSVINLGLSAEFRSIRDRSVELSSSWSSSASNSPSARSQSGGSTQSRGTIQGRATPMLAARFSHPGPGLSVSFWQRYCVK